MNAKVLGVLLAVVGAGVVGTAQTAVSPFVLLLAIGDYPGETYTEGPFPPAEYVFFEGEAMAVDVRVANWGRESAALDLSSGSTPTVGIEPLTPNGAAPVRTARLESVWRDGIDGSEPTPVTPFMSVGQGEAVRWRLLVRESLPPGLYRVRGQVDAVDARGEGVRARRSDFVVEIRARAAGLEAEHARRVAEWLAAQGDTRGSRVATEVLEKVYPDSVAVHLIRSRLAEAEGDVVGARRELDQAAAFMRVDRDVLFRRFARPGQIEDLVDSLRPSP